MGLLVDDQNMSSFPLRFFPFPQCFSPPILREKDWGLEIFEVVITQELQLNGSEFSIYLVAYVIIQNTIHLS